MPLILHASGQTATSDVFSIHIIVFFIVGACVCCRTVSPLIYNFHTEMTEQQLIVYILIRPIHCANALANKISRGFVETLLENTLKCSLLQKSGFCHPIRVVEY